MQVWPFPSRLDIFDLSEELYYSKSWRSTGWEVARCDQWPVSSDQWLNKLVRGPTCWSSWQYSALQFGRVGWTGTNLLPDWKEWPKWRSKLYFPASGTIVSCLLPDGCGPVAQTIHPESRVLLPGFPWCRASRKSSDVSWGLINEWLSAHTFWPELDMSLKCAN